MAFYLDRIQSVQECIATTFNQSSTWSASELQALKSKIDFICAGTSDLCADLEISFKQLLLQYVNIDTVDESSLEGSRAIQLIRFAFDFALQFAAILEQLPKIPFFLLEDLIEHQTISQAKRIWQVVESWVDLITNPVMFNKGKLIVLKTCNSLLRKLSKSCHTEVHIVCCVISYHWVTRIILSLLLQFCGRILMFLATVYPLSEPSALNLVGKVKANHKYQQLLYKIYSVRSTQLT